MIRIGLGSQEKQKEVNDYIKKQGIKKTFVFYPEEFPLIIDNPTVEYITYKDIIEYKPFYHLLEVIDEQTLLVFNECMRTRNRNDLTYNCAHHYCNQTGHKIVFEYFPFVEQKEDFMILLDFINKGKYKGKSFDYQYLKDEDIKVKPAIFVFQTINLYLKGNDIAKYEAKKKHLFDNLGNADPDTIPRQLHIFAGNFKKPFIEPDKQYISRNDRFKMPNVTVYKKARPGNYIVIDFPHRRIDFNDFLKKTGMNDILFINSGLKVDLYYINEFNAWIERLGEFYAQASIY